jgi:hypothetical protein
MTVDLLENKLAEWKGVLKASLKVELRDISLADLKVKILDNL